MYRKFKGKWYLVPDGDVTLLDATCESFEQYPIVSNTFTFDAEKIREVLEDFYFTYGELDFGDAKNNRIAQSLGLQLVFQVFRDVIKAPTA
jgi:hypothetical protein